MKPLTFCWKLAIWSGAAFMVALVSVVLAAALDIRMSALPAAVAAMFGAAVACVLAWAIEDVGRQVGQLGD